MTIVAGVLAVALVVAVWLFLRHQASLEDAWARERRELLNRIQHPEVIPVTPPEGWEPPEFEQDDSSLVGVAFEPRDDV